MSAPTTLPELPCNQEFYSLSPLYTEFSVPEKSRLFELLFTSNAIDLFCTECNEPSVFRPIDNRPIIPGSKMGFPMRDFTTWNVDTMRLSSITTKSFHCSRIDSHGISFFIQVKDGMVSKIGQSVSLKDLAVKNFREYRKVLKGSNYGEFSTAIGLASHGIGVGAFVYLRRIIERLVIQPAYDEIKGTPGWDDDLYQRSRIKQRIELLRVLLPEVLVTNKALYSILSKGIHELSEEECREHFPAVRACIELILTEMDAKRREVEKKKEVQAQIARIAGQA